MHVKIKNKTAVIEFEDNRDGFGHQEVMKDIVDLIDRDFKKFVFDFKHVTISFNSGISGFLIVTVKKIIESGAVVAMVNINPMDTELIKMVGLDDIDKTGTKVIYEWELSWQWRSWSERLKAQTFSTVPTVTDTLS